MLVFSLYFSFMACYWPIPILVLCLYFQINYVCCTFDAETVRYEFVNFYSFELMTFKLTRKCRPSLGRLDLIRDRKSKLHLFSEKNSRNDLEGQSSGRSGLVVKYRTRNREVAGSTHTRFTASNFEQIAKLLCAQANSASYPQRDGK